MKKKSIFKLSGIFLALVFVTTAICLVINQNQNSNAGSSSSITSKKVYEGHGSMAWSTLISRCKTAKYIIVGTALSRGDAVFPTPDAITPYTPITFQVEKIMKGNPPDNRVEFHELGGETENAIYIDEGGNNYQPGDRAILFINEFGGPYAVYCEHPLTGEPILLPPDQFEGLGIPEEYPKDENGNVLFTEDEFVDYVTGICQSLE